MGEPGVNNTIIHEVFNAWLDSSCSSDDSEFSLR